MAGKTFEPATIAHTPCVGPRIADPRRGRFVDLPTCPRCDGRTTLQESAVVADGLHRRRICSARCGGAALNSYEIPAHRYRELRAAERLLEKLERRIARLENDRDHRRPRN